MLLPKGGSTTLGLQCLQLWAEMCLCMALWQWVSPIDLNFLLALDISSSLVLEYSIILR